MNFLSDGPDDATTTIALAHGAGAPMDSDFMQVFAERLGDTGFRVVRFEFPYMAERREIGRKKPPDRLSLLIKTWQDVIAELGSSNLVIGGKSMGGRIASLIVDAARIKGLVCLGYPFHAPRKEPGPNRLEHLEGLETPTLICQGTRDALGTRDEIAGYRLSTNVQLHWLEDGDHSFKPRKASGLTEDETRQNAINAISGFIKGL
ncbi:MAG: alpha/beta hydrolase [Magnetovibrio sp.]|nr:alpha/beta hydrolase [Magnetovibrio sp.]